jgi:hypothetical protein
VHLTMRYGRYMEHDYKGLGDTDINRFWQCKISGSILRGTSRLMAHVLPCEP